MNTTHTGNPIASAFIRDNFALADRLAIVLIHRRANEVRQRLANAEAIANRDFQDWLVKENNSSNDVYVSMNALRPEANGRTKQDIGIIRHVYLDIDEDGPAALGRLLERKDLPPPNFLIESSPDRYQVIWKVEHFTLQEAERLQRGLARDTGSDLAATDAARVLRLPGFANHKYDPPEPVRVQLLSRQLAKPEQFPAFPEHLGTRPLSAGRARPVGNSQSERDWAFARRSLARGESPLVVAGVIAAYRRFEKSNPQEYAERTVRKASESLSQPASAGGRQGRSFHGETSVQVER